MLIPVKRFLFILALIPFGVVYAQEPSLMEQEALVMEQITSDGQVKIQLLWPEVEPNEIYEIHVNFLDPNTDELFEDVQISFEIVVTQHGSLIESYEHLHTDKGNMDLKLCFQKMVKDQQRL